MAHRTPHYPPPQNDCTTPGFHSSPPNHLIPVAPSVAVQLHRLYVNKAELRDHERIWRDRYSYLLARGLELRSRYKPGWTASWLGRNLDPACCDDSIRQVLPMVLDAKRISDNAIVCLKWIKQRTEEVNIANFLATEKMLQDPMNHCVPIWDHFPDPILPEAEFILMPILRPYNDPEFYAVGEVVDFVTQILEGMTFMHSHLVAHGDLTTQNIMMDARPILPNGWHFVADGFAPNGVDLLSPLARIDHPVRYYIVDYDCSLRLSPDQPRQLVENFGGRDGEVPEVATYIPCDPFKVDVFTIGNVLLKDFYQKYHGLEFLQTLIELMMTHDFNQRPTALAALQHWYNVRAHLDAAIARWRLRRQNETVGERVVLDTVAAARNGIYSVKRLFGNEEKKPWSNA